MKWNLVIINQIEDYMGVVLTNSNEMMERCGTGFEELLNLEQPAES